MEDFLSDLTGCWSRRTRRLSFPVIVQLCGKHDPSFWLANDREELRKALAAIFDIHKSAGYYPDDLPRVDLGKAMYVLYRSDQGHEYEDVRLIIPQKIS